MGDILPFVQRVRAGGDWTAEERARLEKLADRFAAAGVRVEVIYGVTDDGDPWCVVKDENEEVLVHVARIGSAFVVHHAVDDVLQSATDLPSALGERLAWTAEKEAALVVPFSRQAQTFMALVVATAFFYESAAGVLPQPEGQAEPSREDGTPLTPALVHDDAAPERREVAAHAVLTTADDPRPATTLPTAWLEPAKASAFSFAAAPLAPAPSADAEAARPAAKAEPEPEPLVLAVFADANVVAGTAGDDRLEGGAGADHLIGGEGNDTLLGGGGTDLLQGGEGDDRIELTADTVAEGGAGADLFVIQAPPMPAGPNTLLGVILDFRPAEGDRLVAAGGRPLPVPPPGVRPTDAGPAGPGGELTTTWAPPTLGPTTTFLEGRRVDVDLDGDGVVDGYVIVREPRPGHAPPAEEPPPAEMLPGSGFGYVDIF